MNRRWIYTMLVFCAGLLMLAGCKKEKLEAASTAVPADPSSFTVRMTDSPGDFAALNVQIDKIEAYIAQEGWVTLNNQTQFVNVLSLTNGKQVQLAQATQVKTGLYTKLKFVFSEQNFVRLSSAVSLPGITLNANGEALLTWMQPREVVIDINHRVDGKAGANVLVDFNVAQSLEIQGNQVLFHPVITEVEDASTGVRGRVDNRTAAAILLTDGVVTYSTYMDTHGDFFLMDVDAGTYNLIVVPVGETMGGPTEHLIEGVEVNNGQITQMGNIHL